MRVCVCACVRACVLTASQQSWTHWNDLVQALLRNGRPLSEVHDVVKSWNKFKGEQTAASQPWLAVAQGGMPRSPLAAPRFSLFTLRP